MDAHRLPSGYAIAAGFALCGWVSWLLLVVVPYERPGTVEVVLWGLMIGALVVGYLTGLAVAVYPPSRRRGFEILIGFTLMYPALFMVTIGTAFAVSCCR